MDDWLDGQLDAAARPSMQHHLNGCAGCRSGYRRAEELRAELRSLPAPEMRPGFAAQALARAAGARPRTERRVRLGLGMALATGVALALGVGMLLFAVRPEPVQTVVLSVRQPESVRLVFNAARALPGSTLTLRLPENVAIVGYGDRRELTWTTDLREGANLLRLPLVVNGPAAGDLVAQLSRGASTKTFRVKIKVRGADATGERPARFASL